MVLTAVRRPVGGRTGKDQVEAEFDQVAPTPYTSL